MAQPPIQLLAEKVIGAKGPDYFMSYHTLRMYMNGLDDAGFEAEIEKVDNPDIFRILWSCGLPYRWQQIVQIRWRGLEE